MCVHSMDVSVGCVLQAIAEICTSVWDRQGVMQEQGCTVSCTQQCMLRGFVVYEVGWVPEPGCSVVAVCALERRTAEVLCIFVYKYQLGAAITRLRCNVYHIEWCVIC